MLIIPKQTARIQWHIHTAQQLNQRQPFGKQICSGSFWCDLIRFHLYAASFRISTEQNHSGIKEPSKVTCAIDFVGSHTKISKAKILHIRINAPNVNLIKCWSNIQSHYQYMLTKSLLSSKPNSIHSLHPFHSIETCAFLFIWLFSLPSPFWLRCLFFSSCVIFKLINEINLYFQQTVELMKSAKKFALPCRNFIKVHLNNITSENLD